MSRLRLIAIANLIIKSSVTRIYIYIYIYIYCVVWLTNVWGNSPWGTTILVSRMYRKLYDAGLCSGEQQEKCKLNQLEARKLEGHIHSRREEREASTVGAAGIPGNLRDFWCDEHCERVGRAGAPERVAEHQRADRVYVIQHERDVRLVVYWNCCLCSQSASWWASSRVQIRFTLYPYLN